MNQFIDHPLSPESALMIFKTKLLLLEFDFWKWTSQSWDFAGCFLVISTMFQHYELMFLNEMEIKWCQNFQNLC